MLIKQKEITLSDYRKTGKSFSRSEPWTIAFVITKTENFVVKGMSQEVKSYIKKNHPYSIYYLTFWHKGKNRGLWNSPLQLYLLPDRIRGRKMYRLSMNTADGFQSNVTTFRNIPKKWISLYDSALLEPEKRKSGYGH